MKLIIAGSRHITTSEGLKIIKSFPHLSEITEIVSGGCRGIDEAGEMWAKENNIKLTIFPANWDNYGKDAGPIRNSQMAIYADELLLIWDGKSRGSANIKSEMKKRKKKIHEVICE